MAVGSSQHSWFLVNKHSAIATSLTTSRGSRRLKHQLLVQERSELLLPSTISGLCGSDVPSCATSNPCEKGVVMLLW